MTSAGRAIPRTEIENVIADVWSDVLRIEGIGLDDDFFALGGHSLSASQVVSRVTRALGVEIPLEEFFARPTVAALAAYVVAAS